MVPEVQREGKPIHGHPILIRREMMEAFLRAPDTTTARDIEHQHQPHILYIPVGDHRIAFNIDTPDDYQRLAASEAVYAEKQA